MPTSSPAYRFPSRHRQVDELVHAYGKTKDPSAPLRDVLRKPEQASPLIYALGRQISLIKGRSLAFDDGQVTVYDRALLELSQDGRDLADNGALELFVTEYLGGLVSAHNVLEVRDVEAQDALGKISDTYGLEVSRNTDNRLYREPSTTSPKKQLPHQYQHEDRSKSPAVQSLSKTSTGSSQNHQPGQNQDQVRNNPLHDHVDRILTIFHRAKEDYHRTRGIEDVEPLSAIRFLRDTAENTILYLRTNGLFDHVSLPELEETFQWTKNRAAELSGGRKRNFDYDGGGYYGKREETEDRWFGAASGRKYDAKRRKGKVRRALIDSYRP